MESLPSDISRATARLQADNRRVQDVMDHLIGRIDEATDAAFQADWKAVRRVSREIAENARLAGYRGISESAQRLCNAAQATGDEARIRRSVIQLIGSITLSR